MPWSLATYVERVASLINDVTQNVYPTSAIHDAIRQALHEYSAQLPIEQQTTLTLADDSPEIDVSSISGILNVTGVWLPYTPDNPEQPPNSRRFRYWPDLQKVCLTDGRPAAGDVARIFYTRQHSINGLDSASVTSVCAAHEWLIVRGAAAILVLSRAVENESLGAWANHQYQMFKASLAGLARLWQGSPFVQTPTLDHHESDWS